jgi:TATA-box binding protein (TBP) (component of TFIID and TFIIIB)
MNESNYSVEDIYNLIFRIKEQNEALGIFLEKHVIVKNGAISIDCNQATVERIFRDVIIIDVCPH